VPTRARHALPRPSFAMSEIGFIRIEAARGNHATSGLGLGSRHTRRVAYLHYRAGAGSSGTTLATEQGSVSAGGAYLMSLVGLLLGWRTRCMAVVAWLTHLAWMTSNKASIYGVDTFAHITLFYCLWMPVGAEASLDRLAGRVSGGPSAKARLSLRVLQLHLCVVYLSSGLIKASSVQWWNGEALWRSLMRIDLGQYDFSWLAAAPGLAQAGCWGTLVLEIGDAFFVWPRRTRRWWAMGIVALHVGIAVAMGLWTFAALMIVLTTSAFLISPEPSKACVENKRPLVGSEPIAA